MVHALFARFLRTHAACVTAAAEGPIDAVLPVPSSFRPSGSPLCTVDGLATAACAPFTGAHWVPDLLTRGAARAGHMRPARGAFAVSPSGRAAVRDRRVLLLDDTYVSGARAQSAAAVLRRAGARATVIVVAGRVLRPDRIPSHATFIRRHASGMVAETGVDPPVPPPCWRCAQTGVGTE
jgi:predicted amidophosphoribosyltransferase